MVFLLSVFFAFIIFLSCFFVASFGKNWNLNPFLALSSGALLVISFLDFMPKSFEGGFHQASFFILMGVLIQGLVDIYGLPYLKFLDRLIEDSGHQHHKHSHILSPQAMCSIVGCLAVCSFFDGIRLFAALSMETSVALMTGLALFFHLLSEGVMVALLGLNSGVKDKVLLILVSFVSGALILGAFLAKIFSAYFQLQSLIAFASGILIYVCFIHLIPFSFEKQNRKWFFLGLSFFFMIHLFFE